jgi:hypothetical protein
MANDDDDLFYTDMYGGDARIRPPTVDHNIPLTPAAAHKQLSGLKITGSHVKRIPIGDQIVDLPSAAYVKLLEDQIRSLRTEVRESQAATRRVAAAFDRMVTRVDQIQRELATKVTLR